MHNQIYLERVSVNLYKYLCEEVVGSENIVRYRRLYFKLHDEIISGIHNEFISSGSKAEGLDLPGSDFDFMDLWKLWEVYEVQPKDTDDVLMLDTDNALPGFALLRKTYSSTFPRSSINTADGNLISNKDFFRIKSNDIAGHLFEIHGPCITNPFLCDIDMLNCLKCHTWPSVARQWLLRFRSSGWPPQNIISKIVSHGCLLVPVGSKTTCSEENSFEWRFSFSLSEKLLVHSFNHTQLLCYALLKIWLKELFNCNSILNYKLCSYFMKTVLFWILEEDETLKWTPQNLLHCFLLCIDRLHYWIACGYFPNYFIPEHNMIDGKLCHDDLAYLLLVLDNMNMRENWKIMFSVPSLKKFGNLPMSIERNLYRLDEFDEAVLSLQFFGNFILDIMRDKNNSDKLSACIIYRLIHKHIPKSARQILILMFLKENTNILSSLHTVNCKNNRRYFRFKEFLPRILISTFYDAESGWVLLAAYFYSTQEYHIMSNILQLSSSIFSLKSRFVQHDIKIQSFRDISKLKKMVYSGSFIKRMRFESTRLLLIDVNGIKAENYPFLTEEFPKGGFFGGLQSQSLFLFLKFLYWRKQGNILETQSALQLLKTIVEDKNDKLTNMFLFLSSYALLLKACELSDDIEEYQVCLLSFINAMKRLDIFATLMKCNHEDQEIKLYLANM